MIFVYVMFGFAICLAAALLGQFGLLDEAGRPSGVLAPVMIMAVLTFIAVPAIFVVVATAMTWAQKGER